jgi:predicted DNA binding protein
MTEVDLQRYPRHYVLAIVDRAAEADTAATELEQLDTEVQVLRGPEAAAALDSDGSQHGMFASLKRAVEHTFAEMDHLQQYEEAVRGGSSVLAVYAEDDAIRERVKDTLARHDARFVNYFGTMAVELVAR